MELQKRKREGETSPDLRSIRGQTAEEESVVDSNQTLNGMKQTLSGTKHFKPLEDKNGRRRALGEEDTGRDRSEGIGNAWGVMADLRDVETKHIERMYDKLKKPLDKVEKQIESIEDDSIYNGGKIKALFKQISGQSVEAGYVQGLVAGYLDALMGQGLDLEMVKRLLVAKYGLTPEQAKYRINKHFKDLDMELPVW